MTIGKPIARMALLVWGGLGLIALFGVHGYLGWWMLGIWIVLTAFMTFCFNKSLQSRSLKTDTLPSASRPWQSGQNRIVLFLFVIWCYLSQFLLFAFVMESHEIKWWMHVTWILLSVISGLFMYKNGRMKMIGRSHDD